VDLSSPPDRSPAAEPAPLPAFAAVILTGGTGARLGGADKASLQVAGRSLLERALDATARAASVVVVGDPVPTSRPVTWAREHPPGGGPAAGLLAGVDALAEPTDLVCVLAVDMAMVTEATVERLLAALSSAGTSPSDPPGPPDAAVLTDANGELQTLAGIYRREALMAARPTARAAESGLSVRRLVSALRLVGVPARELEARDVDTWEDLRDLEAVPEQ
jgi:molybdopterin-guanine dinucleotide biosynthesis protein A